jgi:hypothetical protein
VWMDGTIEARYVVVHHRWYVLDHDIVPQAFLDYIHIMKRLPELHEEIQEQELGSDATQASELDELTRRIPKLIAVLPDALRDRTDPRHNVALAKMISGLMMHLDKVQPLALVCHFPAVRDIYVYINLFWL